MISRFESGHLNKHKDPQNYLAFGRLILKLKTGDLFLNTESNHISTIVGPEKDLRNQCL